MSFLWVKSISFLERTKAFMDIEHEGEERIEKNHLNDVSTKKKS